MPLELKFKERIDLKKTFECGQIFRFGTSDSGRTYLGPIGDRIIKLIQIDDKTISIDSDKKNDLHNFILNFFNMHLDYSEMNGFISVDDLMKEIIKFGEGLRVLRQPLDECICAFILSQQSSIKRIKKNLEALCELYGRKIKFEGRTFYLFPERNVMAKIREDDYKELGFGYRSKYLAELFADFPRFIDDPPGDSLKLNKMLLSIKGIGQKVADCIQPFGFGDLSVFPVDTWMIKFMKKYYFKEVGKISTAEIKKFRKFGMDLFGKYAGYAQELIFYFIRNSEV